MRVLLVEPGRKPRAAEIGSSLEEMQEAVGGLTSLNRIQLEKYYLMFREPELILETEHGMCVFRCSEQVYAEAQNSIRNKEKQPKQKGGPQR